MQQRLAREQRRLEGLAAQAVDKCLYTAYGIAVDPAVAGSTWGGVVERHADSGAALGAGAAQQAFVHLSADIAEAAAAQSEAEAATRLQTHARIIEQLERMHPAPPPEVLISAEPASQSPSSRLCINPWRCPVTHAGSP